VSFNNPKSESIHLVFCTAPEEQVRRAAHACTLPDTKNHFVGPDSSPFRNNASDKFMSWGGGPFTWKTGLKLYRKIKSLSPEKIILPVNNEPGFGYQSLRIFCRIVGAPSAEVFFPSGRKIPLTWGQTLRGPGFETRLFSIMINGMDFLFPLFRLWVKPYAPPRIIKNRTPLQPRIVQDHYESDAPGASVVIRTFNEQKFIGKTLERVLNQKDVHPEVIVIDSESTDQTVEIARRYPVRIYQIQKSSFHYAGVLNLGAQLARGPWVVNLSAHAVPADNLWLKNLLAPMKEDPTFCGVFGRELAIPEWSSPFEKKLLKDVFRDKPVIRSDSFFFSNANAAIPRKLLLETPFNETLEWAEDQEWVHRMQQAGYRTYYQPESPVYHSHNLTLRQCFKRTLLFQRVLYSHMYRHWVREADQSFRSQLPQRAASFKKFLREEGLSGPFSSFFYAPFCEYVNYLGSKWALRETQSSPPEIETAKIPGPVNQRLAS